MSGMKPPCRNPRSARVARKLALPDRAAWLMATIDQTVSCIGTHRSGPIFFDTSCDGSSARRKVILKTVFPAVFM